MPIDFTCPHCGATTRVADEYIGQSGPCAQCGQMITVTPSGQMPGHASVRARSGMPGWVIALIVLGVLAVLALPCAGILVAILVPAIDLARDSASEVQCKNNLRRIGLAVLNYESQHDHLPSPVEIDENGRPVHSWRALLLPYLAESPTYDSYNMDEPWNGPQNAMLSNLIPDVYRCPGDSGGLPGARTSQTSYVMLVGPGTPFAGSVPPRSSELSNWSETILVVELHNSGINWLEPRDITIRELIQLLEDELTGIGAGLNHPRGINVLFADGSVQTLSIDELLMRLESLGEEARMLNQWEPLAEPDSY